MLAIEEERGHGLLIKAAVLEFEKEGLWKKVFGIRCKGLWGLNKVFGIWTQVFWDLLKGPLNLRRGLWDLNKGL